jgi:PD-(D/E)XK endonuclease
MKGRAAGNRTCKQLGEWAELIFMAQAAERGMNVSKPFGDSASYDVGVEHNGRFMRVQVKSTTFRRKGSYTCNIVGPQRERYAPGKLDFFAVYLVPIDVWYIIPFEVAQENLSLNLTPRKGHKFSQYMEAWKLLLGTERGVAEAGGVARPEENEGSGTQTCARQRLEQAFGFVRMRLGG